ncbi:MAG TPA: hypothetical protein VJ180_14880, partial [Pyrinomonadaceae bacterium]|nr:hypothetical protein [Pyrinomonadaceae bacterium]
LSKVYRFGSRTVEPAMAPASVAHQPEHGRLSYGVGDQRGDRVLPASAAPSSIQGEVRANSSMEATRLHRT